RFFTIFAYSWGSIIDYTPLMIRNCTAPICRTYTSFTTRKPFATVPPLANQARTKPAHAATLMIEVEGLTKLYNDFAAVTDLGFAMRPGEVMGLLGPTGTGQP